MEEMKACFGTFREIRTCARCKYRESCRIYSIPEPNFRIGIVSGDACDWEAGFLYQDLGIPEDIYFDDPPEREDTVGADKVLSFLRHLDNLNGYALGILRELISRDRSVSELAASRGVTRQAMNEKLIAVSSRFPWTTPLLILCRRRIDETNLKMLKILKKQHK